MQNEYLLEVDSFSLREAGRYILKDISFKILPGESWAICGPSGSGKSALLKSILHHKMFANSISFNGGSSPVIHLVGHQHRFHNIAGTSDFYYQQRFNSSDSDVVNTLLADMLCIRNDEKQALQCLGRLRIGHLSGSPMIKLSNGEHKRFQIAKALFEGASWLLLDDPYTGLDMQSRVMLSEILKSLSTEGIRCIMVCGREVPDFISHVATIENGMLTGVHTRENFLRKKKHSKREVEARVIDLPAPTVDFNYVLKMKDVQVAYEGRKVLSGINWNVRHGEHWCLSGPNGSGKSTLLSLITADNPQAFANDIYLFDRKRGSGETIWDIKKRIGFVSPELHQYFDRTVTCFKVVASGLHDTIGLFKKLSPAQAEAVNRILDLFELHDVSDKPLGQLPYGRQRWVLLARALVKNPPLVILDEPCQGLDDAMCEKFIGFVEAFCNGKDRTLLYVSHVAEELPLCIGNFLKLQEGKIIEISNQNDKEHHSNSRRWDRA